MRHPDAHRPVIYGTFFHEGVRESEVLDGVSPDHAWPALVPGYHVGRLQRSDGCRAEVPFVVEPGDGPDRSRWTVLSAADGRWKADPVVGDPGPASKDLRLAFWCGPNVPSGIPASVEPTQAVTTCDAATASMVLDGGFVSAPAATMQVVTRDGASYFIRIPPVARLRGMHVCLSVRHAQEGSEGDEAPSPMPLCDGPASMAYNAFLAFGQNEAAFSLGKAVAEGLETGDSGQVGLIDRLVATQWLLRAGPSEAKPGRRMHALDAIGVQSDAATLRWLLAFDTRLTGRETLGPELLTVFARLREEPPIFSETLRLLFERLPAARARLRAKAAWLPEHEAGYRFVVRFARALVWPSIHTTYRGSRPDRPDRNAIDDVATTKKKAVGLGELGSLLNGRDSICVVQVRSSIRRPKVQERTLRGLGLGRLNHARLLRDTPAVRGMIRKVSHLVVVVSVEEVHELGGRPRPGRRFGIPGGTLPALVMATGSASPFREAAE